MSWGMDRAMGRSHPWILSHVCERTWCFRPCGFQKYSAVTPPSSPPRPSIPAYTNTQQRHSETARLTLRVCCGLWPLRVSVGFTGSFRPPCHAWPHRRPWTLTLCAASEARGKNLLAHKTGISSVYVSACVCVCMCVNTIHVLQAGSGQWDFECNLLLFALIMLDLLKWCRSQTDFHCLILLPVIMSSWHHSLSR